MLYYSRLFGNAFRLFEIGPQPQAYHHATNLQIITLRMPPFTLCVSCVLVLLIRHSLHALHALPMFSSQNIQIHLPLSQRIMFTILQQKQFLQLEPPCQI